MARHRPHTAKQDGSRSEEAASRQGCVTDHPPPPADTHLPYQSIGAIQQEVLEAALPCARDTDTTSDRPMDGNNSSTAKGVSGQ